MSVPPIISTINFAAERAWTVGTFFNISFVIPYCFFAWKSKSPVRSPYFVLIAIMTVTRIINYAFRHTRINWIKSSPWLLVPYDIFTLYAMHFAGIVIVFLAFNRMTALLFPVHHNKIWKPKYFTYMIIFCFFWPFIPHLQIVHLWHCYYWIDKDDGYCRQNFIGTNKFTHFSNLITPLVALSLNVTALKKWGANKESSTQMQEIKRKTEMKLLYQSFFSTFFFFFHSLLMMVVYYAQAEYRKQTEQSMITFWLSVRDLSGAISYYCGNLFFEGGLIFLMYSSTIIRECYFKFYHLEWLLHRIRKQWNSSSSGTTTVYFNRSNVSLSTRSIPAIA